MNNVIIYLLLILIWSGTPLAVKISAMGTDPFTGILFRMILATFFGHMLLWVLNIKTHWHKGALIYYVYCNIGFTLGLLLVYISATMIPSGIIALLFGLSPLLCRLLGQTLLKEPPLTRFQWIGLITAFMGLSLVLSEQDYAAKNALLGTLLNILAVTCLCFGSVLLKRQTLHAHPLSKSVCAITCSTMPLTLLWLLFGNTSIITMETSINGWLAIFYLALFGSVAAQAAYFKLLERTSPTIIGLTTLITPIISLYLGDLVEGATFTPIMMVGALVNAAGIALFIVNGQWPLRWKEGRLSFTLTDTKQSTQQHFTDSTS